MRESLPSTSEFDPASASDTAPLLPLKTPGQRRYVDFMFGLDYLSPNSGLLKLMHDGMSARGLSVLLVNKNSVDWAIDHVAAGKIAPAVYLDLCARPGDRFSKLLETLSVAGVHTICNSSQIRWTLKAYSHIELESAGLPLPPTVILKRDDPDRDLSADERTRLGEKVVIKPSYGVAGLGAVVGAEPTKTAIAAAREFDRKDDWLIQKMVRWGRIDEGKPEGERRPAYLRTYNVFGHRTMMWWSNDRGYSILTWADFEKYNLAGILPLTDQIAELTGMDFFSSEVAIISMDPAARDRFVLIDYINDQCDIDPEADPRRSPPKAWIQWICERMAEFVWRRKMGIPAETAGNVYLGAD